jgi:hypothetical protein
MNCGSVWNWHGITGNSECSKFKADIAFMFLAAIFFLVSGLIGVYVVHRKRQTVTSSSGRKRWFRSSKI